MGVVGLLQYSTILLGKLALLTFGSSYNIILLSISAMNYSTISETTMSTNPLDIINRVTSGKSNVKELRTDLIKIRRNTLVFGNTICQISNIAAVEIVSFYAAIPWLALLGVLVALFALISGGFAALIGLLIGAWAGFSLYKYWQQRTQYGLLILLNSGITMIILSPDKDIIQKAALVIYNIMNDEDYSRAINVSIDRRQIQEVSLSEISTSTTVAESTGQDDIVNIIP